MNKEKFKERGKHRRKIAKCEAEYLYNMLDTYFNRTDLSVKHMSTAELSTLNNLRKRLFPKMVECSRELSRRFAEARSQRRFQMEGKQEEVKVENTQGIQVTQGKQREVLVLQQGEAVRPPNEASILQSMFERMPR